MELLMNEPPQTSWFGRNWLWAVPVGCLLPVLVCGGCVSALFFTVVGAIRSSEPYREAVATAMASPEVKAELGEPLEVGFWTNGNIQVNTGGGRADFQIPIKGSKKSGTIYVEATRGDGDWDYSRLELEPEGGGKPIDLRPAPAK
jgi:hypothetical protein